MTTTTKAKTLTYGDLPDSPAYGVFLYCNRCGARYSATRGDYFFVPASFPVVCTTGHHERAMILAREDCRVVAA